MRKKNGFTLVEIISVIALLLVIASIAMPAVVNFNTRTKERNYNRIVQNIKNSSENFIEYYRSDIPFNAEGEYCFKLNVLANLNYVKLPTEPIVNPRTDEEISPDSWIKVNQNSDGTLSYTYPADSCDAWSTDSNLELTLSTNSAYAKKDSDVKLKNYVTSYTSDTTPKRYLKLQIEPSTLDTSSVTTKSISYTVIDLLQGTSIFDSIDFTIKDDPKINIVFLSDSVTTSTLNTQLSTWKTTLKTELNNNLSDEYKNIGIQYNLNFIQNQTTTTASTTTTSKERVGPFTFGCTTPTYKGMYGDDFIVYAGAGNVNYCRPGDQSGYAKEVFYIYDLIDRQTVLSVAGTNECRIDTSDTSKQYGNVYCYYYESDTSNDSDGDYWLYRYYEYVYDETTNSYTKSNDVSRKDGITTNYGGKQEKHVTYKSNGSSIKCTWYYDETPDDCDSTQKTKYDEIEAKYDNSSEEWNTHTNPSGVTYLKNISLDTLKNSASDKCNTLSKDSYETVIYDPTNGYGHLTECIYYTTYSKNYRTYAYIAFQGLQEKFSYNLNSPAEKTYFVVIANNTNKYTQNVSISNINDNVTSFIYADSTTLGKFNLNNSTETTYTSVSAALSDLKTKILADQ